MSHFRLFHSVANLKQQNLLWFGTLLFALAGVGWALISQRGAIETIPTASRAITLTGPVVATMDSPVFRYAKGWQVTAAGADPSEPAAPWQEPAGVLRFTYTGKELALRLAPGDYWGYLYITIDGQPANGLPAIRGNVNSLGQPSGYRTFYAPETVQDGTPTAQWVRVHQSTDASSPHEVYLEVWRSWGQKPLRGVAVDGLPALPWPRWPSIALGLLAAWAGLVALQQSQLGTRLAGLTAYWLAPLRPLLLPPLNPQLTLGVAGIALLLLGYGVWTQQWIITDVALIGLAWCGLQRPAAWIAALLFGLPFYYTYTLPLLPTRAFSLIDIGIFGGLLLVAGHWVLARPQAFEPITAPVHAPSTRWRLRLLVVLIGWALLAAVQATHADLAVREWRTVFLTGGLFALLLIGNQRRSRQPAADRRLLLGAWLCGALVVALVGLWQYATKEMVINAEGVQRVRAFYGSPNNLALYLERALAPLMTIALFSRQARWRWLSVGGAVLVGSALLLTFSKGALLFGLPALLVVLWGGGLVLLRQRGQSTRILWVLAATGLFALVALTPFLATERFQRLLDFQGGTGFVRLQLWRSAWQMALDHPLFGVGPDNFLYAYRSDYLLPAAWQEPNLNHPHNWLLDWWTRLGLPGLVLASLWFGTLFFRQWRSVRAGQQAVLQLGLLAAGVAALAHGLIDASYALPDLMIIWVLLTFLATASAENTGDALS